MTTAARCIAAAAVSPDSTKIAFGDKDRKLYFVDVESGGIETVDQAVDREIRRFSWSPDSRWLAYESSGENRERSIYLYSLKTKSKTALTSTFTDDSEPVFDPDGKYLYFVSNAR